MRVVAVSSMLVFVACGGAGKHAESAGVDTSSLESASASSSTASATADPPKAAAATAASSTSSPTATASSGPPEASAAADKAPYHPTPSVTGSIDGKPFAPKLARVAGPLQKDGRVLLSLSERADCTLGADLKPGDATLTMLVPWSDGYKVDLGALKRGTKKGSGEIALTRVGAGGKPEVSTTFKPTGRVTIVSAPKDASAFGKMKIDLQSGDYMLAGDLDVQVCVPAK
jgi:hypothetical protein